MKKKFMAFLLATSFAMSLVGCGNNSDDNISITEDVNISTVDNEYISVDYPSDKWEALDIADYNELIPLILSYNDNEDTSISVMLLEATDDLEGLLEELEAGLTILELEIVSSEIRTIGNREALYMESSMPIYLEDNEYAESHSISMGVLNNGKLALMQAYVNDSEKEDILQAMNIMVQTIEIKDINEN